MRSTISGVVPRKYDSWRFANDRWGAHDPLDVRALEREPFSRLGVTRWREVQVAVAEARRIRPCPRGSATWPATSVLHHLLASRGPREPPSARRCAEHGGAM